MHFLQKQSVVQLHWHIGMVKPDFLVFPFGETLINWGLQNHLKKIFFFHLVSLCLVHAALIIHIVIILRADRNCFFIFPMSISVQLQKVPYKLKVKHKREELQWTHFTPSSSKWPCEGMYKKKPSYFSVSGLFSNREVKVSLLAGGETQMSCWRMTLCVSL